MIGSGYIAACRALESSRVDLAKKQHNVLSTAHTALIAAGFDQAEAPRFSTMSAERGGAVLTAARPADGWAAGQWVLVRIGGAGRKTKKPSRPFSLPKEDVPEQESPASLRQLEPIQEAGKKRRLLAWIRRAVM